MNARVAPMNHILPKTNERDSIERLAKLFDSAFQIPGTKFRIGLDGLVGLIPGVGDFIGLLFSLTIIYRSAALGVPVYGLLMMVGNVAIDSLFGSIPILGDIFDFGWKANIKNVELLQKFTISDEPRRRSHAQISKLTMAFLAIVLLAIIAAATAFTIAILKFAFGNI